MEIVFIIGEVLVLLMFLSLGFFDWFEIVILLLIVKNSYLLYNKWKN